MLVPFATETHHITPRFVQLPGLLPAVLSSPITIFFSSMTRSLALAIDTQSANMDDFFFKANPVGNYSAGPSRSRQHDISTPSRVQEASSDAGSVSLPSRKRERTLTTSYGQQSANKSRRTTPTPMDSFSFGSSPTRASNLNGLDFIDLTG